MISKIAFGHYGLDHILIPYQELLISVTMPGNNVGNNTVQMSYFIQITVGNF
jgi:hypothetical protein